MILSYENKKSEADILENTPKADLKRMNGIKAENKLIFGDNLSVLSALLSTHRERVDLIYIDPPFATNTTFKISEERANSVSTSKTAEIAYEDTLINSPFLEFIRQRLIFLRELLSSRGSIYLHIDYKIGHYVKIIMDEVFGRNNFRNDITRIKCNPKNFPRKSYGNIKDLILFYSKSDKMTWNDPRLPFTREDFHRLFRKTDIDGRRYTTIPLHAPGETKSGNTGKPWRGISPPVGRHWRSDPAVLEEWEQQDLIEWSPNGVPRKKIFAGERPGKRMQDIWGFKDSQQLDYPTQKPLDLLECIIEASSNEGDIVLDCFCGSGTTLVAAHKLNRNWIGIDNSEHAIRVARDRLANYPNTLFATSSGYEFLVDASNLEAAD